LIDICFSFLVIHSIPPTARTASFQSVSEVQKVILCGSVAPQKQKIPKPISDYPPVGSIQIAQNVTSFSFECNLDRFDDVRFKQFRPS
jgi:hypothetical protein